MSRHSYLLSLVFFFRLVHLYPNLFRTAKKYKPQKGSASQAGRENRVLPFDWQPLAIAICNCATCGSVKFSSQCQFQEQL